MLNNEGLVCQVAKKQVAKISQNRIFLLPEGPGDRSTLNVLCSVRLCFLSPYWTSLELIATSTQSTIYLLFSPFEEPVRLCPISAKGSRTADREVNTAYYPVDRGRYPLLTRQDSESPTEGAAAFNLAFPQPCTSGFRFLQSMSCTTHGCAQRERLSGTIDLGG